MPQRDDQSSNDSEKDGQEDISDDSNKDDVIMLRTPGATDADSTGMVVKSSRMKNRNTQQLEGILEEQKNSDQINKM